MSDDMQNPERKAFAEIVHSGKATEIVERAEATIAKLRAERDALEAERDDLLDALSLTIRILMNQEGS